MIVYKITEQTANNIKGVEYTKDVLFNPIQDVNGNFVISFEELKAWSLNLDLFNEEEIEAIEYEPIEVKII